MPTFVSPVVEEFFNRFHSKRDGRFTSGGAPSGRAGFREGSHSGAGGKTGTTNVGVTPQSITNRKANYDKLSRDAQKKLASDVLLRNNPYLRKGGGSGKAAPENFVRGDKRVGPAHSKATNSVMAKQAAHRQEAGRQIDLRNERIQARLKPAHRANQTKVPTGPQHGNRGGPVLGANLPLRNATTGRLNPKPAHAAFKQGEVIGKKQDSKRTTLQSVATIPTRFKTRTVGTYKGHEIKHISSKGGAQRAGFREGQPTSASARESTSQALAKAWYASRVAARGK